MSRKSSVHFKPVSNVRFAVSHSERTDLSEPGYLLPKEHQLPNVVVDGSLSENDLAALFIQQKERMTGQAKARGSSPFWEGVVVLPNTDAKEQSANLLAWKKAYEQATGHRVLHMSIHLDEGYVDATGHPQYNPHAHVIVSRMNEQNRVIKLERKQLAAVQDITAEALKMERGSTLAERGGKRGRRHVGHREYRAQADEARLSLEKPKADLARLQKKSKEWSDADLAKINQLQAKLDGEPARQAAALAAQKLHLDEQYRLDREALKASGEAKQADYQQLKKAHEKALDELTASKAETANLVEQLKVQATINGNLLLNEDSTHKQHLLEIDRLKAEYAAERAALKASGEATQRDYQALKVAHEKALADLATAQTEAAKVPDLVEQLKASQEQATTAKAQADKLAADLKTAQQEADKVPGLVEKYTTLRTKALAIQEQRNDLALKVETMTQENQHLRTENERLEADKARFAAMAREYQAEKAKGTPAHLIKPSPVEALKRPVAAPKPPEAPSPSPIQEKSLVERLAASLAAMLEWLKAIGGVQEPVGPSTLHIGPVLHADELHCIQKTGRRYAVHQLADLDAVPALDDPKMEIQYRDGKGHVSGRTVPGLQR